jgi:hypothetical protein
MEQFSKQTRIDNKVLYVIKYSRRDYMNKIHAEEDLKIIRDVMETSARYTSFSGISGVFAGLLALAGCGVTYWISNNIDYHKDQNLWYTITWVAVFITAISQDFLLARSKARRCGESIWNPASIQVIKALIPGVFISLMLSIYAAIIDDLEVIPAIWTLGYGVAICAAGRFSVSEVRIFGVIQLITGALGLFLLSDWMCSLCFMGLTFGVYHIIYGLWLMRRYGW